MKRKLWHEKSEFGAAAKLSDRLLRRCGPLVLVSPNLITVIGGLLVVPMFLAFHAGTLAAGAVLFGLSLLTDWLDGALARYQTRYLPAVVEADARLSEWIRLGPTELGKKIDPVVDKLRYYGALWPLGWQTLPHWLMWASLTFALGLTFFREGVRLLWGLKPAANAVGKIKVYVEAATIAFLVFLAAGAPLAVPALVLFIAATSLGAGSLFTQAQSIRRQLHELEKALGLRGLRFLEKARRIRAHLKSRPS